MEKLARYLTRQLLRREMIEETQCDIYQYNLECLLGKVINMTIILLLALHIDMFVQSVIFLFFFLMIREKTGGYHASTELGCSIGTVVIYLCIMKWVLPIMVAYSEWGICCVGLTIIIILLWAPVNHPNIDFSLTEIKQGRTRSYRVLCMEVLIVIVLYYFNIYKVYCCSAILGMSTCAFLVVIAKIMKQEVRENERE